MHKTPTIAHVGQGGGVMGVMSQLAHNLPAYQHRLIAFGPQEEVSVSSDLRVETLQWSGVLNPLGAFLTVRKLRKRLRALQPDIVLLHGFPPVALGAAAAHDAGAKYVVAIDHGPQPTYTFAKRFFWNHALPNIHGVISVATDAQAWLLKHFPKTRKVPCVVIENSINNIKFSAVKRQLKKNAEVLLTMVSRLDAPQKDPLTLLEAFAIVKKQIPNARLRLAGEGNLRKQITKTARALYIADSVTLGFEKNVPELLAQTDIFILSSNWEGLPLSLIEAMAAGVAVVGSRVPGIQGIIADDQNGRLVTKNNPAVLASVLILLAQDTALRQRLGLNAQTFAASRFSEQRMINEYAEFLKKLTF